MDTDYPPISTLRNLNLSYNSLHIDECAAEDGPNEEFIENLIEFITYSEVLNHLDISGMNLGRDYNPEKFAYQSWIQRHNTTAPILAICSALSSSYTIMSMHLSDNGLRDDEELFLEVLDNFGLDQMSLQKDIGFVDPKTIKNNKPILDTQVLRNIIKIHTGAITTDEIENIDVDAYQKHIF